MNPDTNQPPRDLADLLDEETRDLVTKRAHQRGMRLDAWVREAVLRRLLFENLIAEFGTRLELERKHVTGGQGTADLVGEFLTRLLELEGVEADEITALRKCLREALAGVLVEAIRAIGRAA